MIKSIMAIFSFMYNFLFIDQDKGKMSQTKFWANVGYGIMCYTFVYAVIMGSKADIMLWLIFGIVVIGNRSLMKLFGRSPTVNTDKPE